ncbi:MAG: RNA-binding protein [candidate division KSB1 bacterium]|nr:RNA-binding protein [candidate division KSB1 bacterium]MDZ7276554.1 RNA-binding protein [candidate division KSB1 bacterium]MDZ7285027.1 RNA-binding protein [candidate division KSB1 bacterium]MDZ7298059.1 RNA-binding protein [candidate division KSB1 bacterium]MDZ7307447.1 RNA-binding protein [candidate division KSB1 bacterium]
MNIYVGNIARSVTEDELREAFAAHGEVSSVTLIKDKFTGEPRGFAFVEMPSKAQAIAAMKEMDGREMQGRSLIVNEARPKADKRGGGGGRGAGGRGGRSGGGGRGGFGSRF